MNGVFSLHLSFYWDSTSEIVFLLADFANYVLEVETVGQGGAFRTGWFCGVISAASSQKSTG